MGLRVNPGISYSHFDLADPANSTSGESWFGFGPPLVIAAVLMGIGVVLMIGQRIREPEFFRRKLEVVDPHVAIHGASQAGTPTGGA